MALVIRYYGETNKTSSAKDFVAVAQLLNFEGDSSLRLNELLINTLIEIPLCARNDSPSLFGGERERGNVGLCPTLPLSLL